METIEIQVFGFDELSAPVQSKVLDKFREATTDYEWWDFILDDAKTIASLMGLDGDFHFSLGYSQSDYCSFTGHGYFRKKALQKVKEYAPLDTELHRICKEWVEFQRKGFYSLEVKFNPSNYGCSRVDYVQNDKGDYLGNDKEKEALEIINDLCHWLYKMLRKEYEYLSSDEVVKEFIEANEYRFTEDGRLI